MKSKPKLRLAVIFIAWLAATSCSLPAQESARAERCKLINTSQQHYPKLVFDYIRLDPSSDVSNDVWQSVVTSIKQRDLEAHPGWVDELQQAAIVFGLFDRGYVRATATVQTSNVNSDPAYQHVGLTVHIETGPQYKLSTITFRSVDPNVALVLGDAELRSLVPLQDGEPFSASKLRLAFNQLRKTYDAQGYVDFVPSPEMKFDDTNHQVALVLELDQGKQYRIGTITVRGLSPRLEKELRQNLRSGDVLDYELVDDFYNAHRSELPADATVADVENRKDVKGGTADLAFDFRGCSEIQPEDTNVSPPSPGRILRKRVDP